MGPHMSRQLPERQRGAQSTRRVSLREVERDPSQHMGQSIKPFARRNTTHLFPYLSGPHLLAGPIDELREGLRGACSFRSLLASFETGWPDC